MELFPFQREGADWLAGRSAGLLADEMGLGKTIQAVRAADRSNAARVLVVSKAVGRRHWAREFAQHGRIERRACLPRPGDTIDPTARLVVIHYDILHRPEILKQLLPLRFDTLIADEMHSLKAGADSLRGQVVLDRRRGLIRRARMTWGLSGTPAPNHAGDLWPWLSALHADQLGDRLAGSYDAFLQHYCRAEQTPYGWRVRGNRRERVRELRDMLHGGGIMLRRKREEVLPDLPPLRVDTVSLDGDASRDLQLLEGHPDIDAVRDVLLGLDVDEHPAEAAAAWEQDLSTLRRLTGLAKVRATADMVRAELEGIDKIVVMGWHQEVLEQLARELSGYRPILVHGGSDPEDKERAEEQFQTDPDRRVFIGNILSAGTTITLTATHRMLVVEPSWVPGDNEQAILRILRIGQDHPCEVSFVALAGSVDEIVQAVYARKADMLTDFM